jgi:hypothetical protein
VKIYDDETSSWKEASIQIINGQRYAFFGSYDPNTYVTIQYREKNSCGYSNIRNSSLITPPPPAGCSW